GRLKSGRVSRKPFKETVALLRRSYGLEVRRLSERWRRAVNQPACYHRRLSADVTDLRAPRPAPRSPRGLHPPGSPPCWRGPRPYRRFPAARNGGISLSRRTLLAGRLPERRHAA